MEWVDSNIIPWTGHGPFFGWQPSQLIFPYPLWNPYGMPMEWCLPYAVHRLVHMDSMEFPVNLYSKSMYYSIWIPWNESIKFRGKAQTSNTQPYRRVTWASGMTFEQLDYTTIKR